MSIFADTSALYPLLVRTERSHSDVARTFREILDAGRVLATTNYVLVETSALLQHRLGLVPVHDLTETIAPLLRMHWVDQDLHGRAVARLFRADRRHLSLVDCVSFEVMEREGIREAFALDRHFEEEGFKLLPAPPRRPDFDVHEPGRIRKRRSARHQKRR